LSGRQFHEDGAAMTKARFCMAAVSHAKFCY